MSMRGGHSTIARTRVIALGVTQIDESVAAQQSLVEGEHFFPIERLGKLVSRDNFE